MELLVPSLKRARLLFAISDTVAATGRRRLRRHLADVAVIVIMSAGEIDGVAYLIN